MRLFAKIRRTGIVTEPLSGDGADAITVAREIDQRARVLFGRALAIRQVDAGSCSGCELEIMYVATVVCGTAIPSFSCSP
jgi:hypothetical protein